MKEDIKNRLLKIAEDKAIEKLNQERERNEKKIKEETEYVETILKMIDRKMLYKVTENDKQYQKFIVITEDIFFQDYMNEPKETYYTKGIKLKDYKSFSYDNYEVKIEVNGIRYKHIGSIIQEFENELKNKIRRINYITEGLWELEKEFKELANQEKNIKKFVEDYNKNEREILGYDE